MHRTAPMETSEEQNLFFSTPTRSSRGASAGQVKNFVLDTNVLLHDPHCLNRFDNNHLFIPVEVLSELDRFKNEQTERGANARTVHRFLTQIFDHETKKVTRGVKTAGGGTVRIFMNDAMRREKPSPAMRRFAKIFPAQAADRSQDGIAEGLPEGYRRPRHHLRYRTRGDGQDLPGRRQGGRRPQGREGQPHHPDATRGRGRRGPRLPARRA